MKKVIYIWGIPLLVVSILLIYLFNTPQDRLDKITEELNGSAFNIMGIGFLLICLVGFVLFFFRKNKTKMPGDEKVIVTTKQILKTIGLTYLVFLLPLAITYVISPLFFHKYIYGIMGCSLWLCIMFTIITAKMRMNKLEKK